MSSMSSAGNAKSGGIRLASFASSRYINSDIVGSGLPARTKLRDVRLLYPISLVDRSTPAFCATLEWQLAVAQLGSMMAAEINDHCAGRSSAPPQPATKAQTTAPSETAVMAFRNDIAGDYAQTALVLNVFIAGRGGAPASGHPTTRSSIVPPARRKSSTAARAAGRPRARRPLAPSLAAPSPATRHRR